MRARAPYFNCTRSRHQQTNPLRILYSIRKWSSLTRMNSPVSFLTNRRQDRLQRGEIICWNKIINALKRSRENINPFTTFKPSGWKCYKTIGSYVSCASIEIWSTWEVWLCLEQLLRIFRAFQTSACFISRWTHADVWTNCLLH